LDLACKTCRALQRQKRKLKSSSKMVYNGFVGLIPDTELGTQTGCFLCPRHPGHPSQIRAERAEQ
jgi:hypothetical protein